MSQVQANFAEFCSHTSLHGWSYLSNPTLPAWRRIFWLMTILFSLGVAAYYLRWFVHNFHDHKVSTTIETTTAPLSELFPQAFEFADEIPERIYAIQQKIQAPSGVKNGVNNGMTLMLDAEIYDYGDIRSPSNGFVLALHHHLDVPVIQQQGFNVAPGTFTQIAVSPILESTTEMAKMRFKPLDRGCYFQSEIALKHWPYGFKDTLDPEFRSEGGHYSMSNCLYEAVLEEIPSQCNCTPNFHAIGFNIQTHPPCLGRGITCVNKILGKLGILDTIQDGDVRKKCLAACESQINRYQLSTIPYPNDINFLLRPEVCRISRALQSRCQLSSKRMSLDETYGSLCSLIFHLNGSDACAKNRLALSRLNFFNTNITAKLELIDLLRRYAHENIAIVKIYIKDPFVTKLLRDEAFSVVLFVAGAGGLMGLCTGFSFLSGVEILYFLGLTLGEKMKPPMKTVNSVWNLRRRKSTKTDQTDTSFDYVILSNRPLASRNVPIKFALGITVLLGLGQLIWADDCHRTRVVHALQYPGCEEKRFTSFACTGRCTSYVQVSGSKMWLQERSCMCCQESGEREAIVGLYCPNAKQGEPKWRKFLTKAPANCMCRPCTAVEDEVMPSDIAGYSNTKSMMKSFIKL
eukprot:maker-scaffold5_size1054832-snap-gene-5.11 protein:Tk04041 transcript:maker-scaffold5_size1054832-snap-gene-5.11-mRNA-1 annotation:"bursicon alpha"